MTVVCPKKQLLPKFILLIITLCCANITVLSQVFNYSQNNIFVETKEFPTIQNIIDYVQWSNNNNNYDNYENYFAQNNLDTVDFNNNNENRNQLHSYFDDLNIIDRTIYERYFHTRPQFIFLSPPEINRENILRNASANHGLFRLQPEGYSSTWVLDTARYLNDFEIHFIRKEFIDIGSARENDTTQNNFGRYELSASYTVHLDKYLAMRKEQLQTQIRDSLTKTYDLKKAMSRGDLALLLGQATGISIPLPPNPVLNLFGKPELAINVNGQVNVTIGWRWDKQNLSTASAQGQLRSSPIFRQDVRVNVNARIGDKLRFNIDHNTRSMFEFDKKFKIGYEGYDDDIIKKVEIGNIDFQIPSTLITSASELFGIRADFQFGPLWIKTAVSQRRGRSRTVDVTGGTSKSFFSIRAWNYARNHFFLDTAYKRVYNEYFKHSTPIIPQDHETRSLRIKQIQVWEASQDLTNPHTSNAVAHADLEGKRRRMGEDWDAVVRSAPPQTGVVERNRFTLLDSNQYRVDYNLGTLTLRNFREDRTYAVSYRIEGATPDTLDDIYYGNFSDQVGLKDTLILKLIYTRNLLPAYTTLWSRQMKNKYNIGASNVNLNETKIGVWYTRKTNDSTDLLEGANDKIVTMLRVDRVTNSTGAEPPDGVFDLNNPAFFDAERGVITFPHSEPFGDGLVEYFRDRVGNAELANAYVYRAIYDTTVEVARKNTARDRFIITGEMSGRASNRISLNAFNLSPGSVRVTLDGVLLREFEDYTVEYHTGTLIIRNPRATMPNANLRVEFEQRDVFTSATKTFLGIRADYELYKSRYQTATIGATAVRFSQARISDRARLGDEPLANTMFGFDFKWDMDAPWLTKALDMLPFYDTKVPSSMSLFGEWAMVMPTPNRIRSEIASDNNQPVVEIDYFEAVTRTTTLGTSFMSWQHSSQPVNPEFYSNGNPDLTEKEQDNIAQGYRGRMYWWQYSISRVSPSEVYPENRSYQGGMMNNLPVLYIHFEPDIRGIYNQNPNFLDSLNPEFHTKPVFWENPHNKEKIWGGMQRFLPNSSHNFDNDNVEFLDVMINVRHREQGQTRIFFDIGMISEDLIPNGIGDTEDGITAENPLPNGILDPGEDVGIDGVDNAVERNSEHTKGYPFPLNLEDDPARDDFRFNFNKRDEERGPADYTHYNNFEGNGTTDWGLFPDKEMMNPNNGQTVSLDNAYFTYELNIDDLSTDNPQVIGGNPAAGWLLYRIPIRRPTSKVGEPQYSNMQYVRFRVQGGAFRGEIADWKLIGNHWMRDPNFEANYDRNDSVLSVSYVNLWENSGPPDFYTMPPGVQAPRQLGGMDYSYDARLNEQSLSLSVRNLLWGEERMAVRIFHDQDFFNYKRLKYFIHGDGSMPISLSMGSKARAYSFIRFGIDSGNYYEYRRPLVRGWQEIDIDLAQLTAIKQVRDTNMIGNEQTFPVPGDPFANFVIKGNPILTRVRFVGFGIENPSDAFQELTTTMWVNELRLLSPEASNDWAGVMSFSANLADLGTINASFSNYEPNYHTVEERYGKRSRDRDWNVVITGNLEKFAPRNWSQMRVPISYSHLERMENPKYVASNDIELAAAATTAYNNVILNGGTPQEAQQAADDVRLRSSTLSVQDSWSLAGVKTGIPISKNAVLPLRLLVNEGVNRVTTSYSYSQIFDRSPIYQERFQWTWRLGLNYNLPIPELVTFTPFKNLFSKDQANPTPTSKQQGGRPPQGRPPVPSISSSEGIPFFGAYKDYKINLLPSSFSLNLNMQRRRQTEQSRFLETPSPVVRDFNASRGASFNWRLAQNGILSPSIDYSFTTGSTLVPWELDEMGRQRTGSQIANELFTWDKQVFNFGLNNNHTQNLSISMKPMLPNVIGLNRFLDLNGSYTSNYMWRDPLQPNPEIRDVSKSSAVNSSMRWTLGIRLKEIGNNIFGTPTPAPFSGGSQRGGSATPPPTSNSSGSVLTSIGKIFQTVFFDWERLNVNYNLTNASVNSGVFGSTGLDNFWGRGMTFRESQMHRGPAFSYQLGLISNPHGSWQMVNSDRFPFFGFSTEPGIRPANATLVDNFNQANTFDIRTSRQLWPGATIDLNWKTSLTFNKNMTIDTDEFGRTYNSVVLAQDNLNRTFLSMPDFFGLHLFGNPITKIVGIWEDKVAIIDQQGLDTMQRNEAARRALSEAFYEGLEAHSFTSGTIGKFLPAVNWTLRWEGLEKFPLWNNVVRRMQFEHNYTSTYVEIGQTTDVGRIVQTQSMQSGFSPLFGVTSSFDEKIMKGVLTASIKWSETSNYSATTASGAIISLQRTTDITAQASYVMKGFSMPMFGFNMRNDFEVSFLFTFKKNNTGTFDVMDPNSYSGNNAGGGRTLTGNKQIIIEPRARYNISQMITSSFFIRYEGTFNEGAANPGFHNIQIGLDIMINISGGR